MQLTLGGEFVKEWVQMKDAAVIGMWHQYILACCKGRQISYKGYRWMYKKEYEKLKLNKMAEVKQELEYNEALHAVITEGDVVFYIEDIHPEVIAKVCELYNEGKEKKDIQEYLDNGTQLCTVEEGDFIIEQLTNWEKVSGSAAVEKKEPIEKLGHKEETQKLMKETAILQEVTLPEKKELSRGEKAAATRKANSASKVVGKGNAATLIASMQAQQEKIKRIVECIEWIDESLNTQDIPESLQKSERDVLLAYVKEVENVQLSYLQKIQAV